MSNPIKPFTITHNDYEKLVDDIYFLGNNTILRMNVILGKKLDDGRRYFYHSEFMYSTNKYIDTNRLITMRRSFEYYLTIENIKNTSDREKESIMIRVQDMLHMRHMLDKAYKWFTSDQFRDLFAYSKSKLVILGKIDPIIISGLPAGKKITIEPTVVQYDSSYYEGVRIYLNNNNNYIDMTVDRFMGLIYLINTIDLYQSAQLLLNYHGRPELGEHVVTFNDTNGVDDSSFVQAKANRQIPLKNKQKSYFDKIDEL